MNRIDHAVAREKSQKDETPADEGSEKSQAHGRGELSTEYEAPRTETERMLVNIWQEMLGIEKVGIHDNFFELGGDSLLNIRLTAMVNRAGVRMTPKQIFEHQTVAELAEIVGGSPESTVDASDGVRLLGQLD